MKQRITSLAVVLCLLLSLTACGGGQNQAENGGQDAASAPMTEEAYQEQVTKALGIRKCASTELGAVIGVHSGPGCYGLAYIGLK